MASTYELIIKAVDRTSGPLRDIERSLKSAGTAAQRLSGDMSQMSSGRTASGLGGIAASATAMRGAFLAAGAGIAAAAGSLKSIIDASRDYQQTENSLRLVTNGTSDLAAQMSRLQQLAQQNRTSFAATAELYTKLKISTDDLGFSTNQVEKLVTKLSQALQVAGADGNTTSAVIRQFGQAMASGTVRGDEFNSIVEGLGPALSIMAKESGYTIGQLRTMSQAGDLSAEVFANMLLNSNALTDSFNRMRPTIASLETAFGDSFTRLAKNIGVASGATGLYESVLKTVTAETTTFNQALEANDTQYANVTERITHLTSEIDRLDTRMKTFSGVPMLDILGVAVNLPRIKAMQMEVERLKALQADLSYNETELQRLINRSANAEGDRGNAIRRSAAAAKTAYEAFAPLVKSSLGKDSVYELSDAVGKARIEIDRLKAAQAGYQAAVKAGVIKENADEYRGLSEALKIAEGNLRQAQAQAAATAQANARQAEVLRKQQDDQRKATDSVYRLTSAYQDKRKQLQQLEAAQSTFSRMLNAGTGDAELLGYGLRIATREAEELRKEMSGARSTTELITHEAIQNAIKYAQELSDINTELAIMRSVEDAAGTDTLGKVAVVALERQRDAIIDLQRAQMGLDAMPKTFEQQRIELERGVAAAIAQADVNRQLYAEFATGARSTDELAQARQRLSIEEKRSTDVIAETIKAMTERQQAVAAIDAALLNHQSVLAGTTITSEQFTAELRKQREALMGVAEVSVYDTILKSAQDSIKATQGQAEAFQRLNLELGQSPEKAELYRAAMEKLSAEGFEPAKQQLRDMTTLSETIQKQFKSTTDSMASDLARSLAKGKLSLDDFSNYFDRILEDIAAAIIQKNITAPLVDGITGLMTGSGGGAKDGLIDMAISFGKSYFGVPGAANGGIISGNKPTLVGERGPELFMPNTTGSIVPREQLNTGGGETIVNFNINAVDTQTGVEFLLKNKPSIIGMITQAQNQRGRQGITS